MKQQVDHPFAHHFHFQETTMLIPANDIHFGRARFFYTRFLGERHMPVYLPPMPGFGS